MHARKAETNGTGLTRYLTQREASMQLNAVSGNRYICSDISHPWLHAWASAALVTSSGSMPRRPRLSAREWHRIVTLQLDQRRVVRCRSRHAGGARTREARGARAGVAHARKADLAMIAQHTRLHEPMQPSPHTAATNSSMTSVRRARAPRRHVDARGNEHYSIACSCDLEHQSNSPPWHAIRSHPLANMQYLL